MTDCDAEHQRCSARSVHALCIWRYHTCSLCTTSRQQKHLTACNCTGWMSRKVHHKSLAFAVHLLCSSTLCNHTTFKWFCSSALTGGPQPCPHLPVNNSPTCLRQTTLRCGNVSQLGSLRHIYRDAPADLYQPSVVT
jgi:hypothetical protein